MKSFLLISLSCLLISAGTGLAFGRSTVQGSAFITGTQRSVNNFHMNRSIPQGNLNRPLYNPYFSINYGPLYEPYQEPCYYDEYYGQWVGPCDVDLTTPGFSRTIPNRIRR